MQVLRNFSRCAPVESIRDTWTPMPLEEGDDPRSARRTPRSARSVRSDAASGSILSGSLESIEEPDSAREEYERLKDLPQTDDEDDGIEDIKQPSEPMPENIYGFVIASLIHDAADVGIHPEHWLHSLRIFGSFTLSIVMFGLQLFFVIQTKTLVTPHDVHDASRVYAIYETEMYKDSSGKSHTFNTSSGMPRGIDEFFNVSNFQNLSDDDKSLVCRIPLSQPYFLLGVLFIWALTVLSHMRVAMNVLARLVALKRIDSMVDALGPKDSSGKVEVIGLTTWLKCALVFFVQGPRIIMSSILLWLGARWLIATIGFGDLLLNALALEFILNLSHLLYAAMVPYSGKKLVQGTLLPHLYKTEHENRCNMFGMFGCGVIAVILCIVYMVYLQAVLPIYKWDVHQACKAYLAAEMAV